MADDETSLPAPRASSSRAPSSSTTVAADVEHVRASRSVPWLGTSWKMNKTTKEARDYAGELVDWATDRPLDATVSVFPPFTAIAAVRDVIGHGPVSATLHVGAQNMHWEDAGSFTGEVSPPMLVDLGCDAVEIGHFERRSSFAETDAAVNRKVRAAIRHGLDPVVCVGESSVVRDFGVVLEFVGMQVKVALSGVAADSLGRVVIAYEPGWAIGVGGSSADVEAVRTVHRHIRKVIAGTHGPAAADRVRIVYGGSVDLEAAHDYATIDEVDGLFVGRAALDPGEFIRIVEAFADARPSPDLTRTEAIS